MFPFLLSSCQAKIIYCLVEKTSEAEVSLQVGNHSPDQWCSAGTATLRDEQDFQGQTANRQCRGNIHPAGTCTLLQFACSESHHRLLKAIKTDFASLSAEVCSSRISLKAWCIRKLLPPHHFSTCTLTVTSWYSFLVGFFSSISRRAFFFFFPFYSFFFFPHEDRNPKEHWLEWAAASACLGDGHRSSHGCCRSGGGHVGTVSGTGLVQGLRLWVCHAWTSLQGRGVEVHAVRLY